jgi:hypothetical protein
MRFSVVEENVMKAFVVGWARLGFHVPAEGDL